MNNQTQQQLLRRLKLIEGQIRGIQAMINNNKYCIDVITQTSAIKQAISGVEDTLLAGHLQSCLIGQIQKGHSKKAVDEVLKVYKLKRK